MEGPLPDAKLTFGIAIGKSLLPPALADGSGEGAVSMEGRTAGGEGSDHLLEGALVRESLPVEAK